MSESLCERPYYKPVIVPASEYRENPAFPVNEGYEAYTTLAECQKLVYDTLGHISRTRNFKYRLNISVEWNPTMGVVTSGQTGTAYRPGHAAPERMVIQLQPKVFYYYTPEERANTIIHESCHAANQLLGERDAKHGPLWVALMNLCEVPADEFAQTPRALVWSAPCRYCGKRWGVDNPGTYELLKYGAAYAMCLFCGKKIDNVAEATSPTALGSDEWKRYMK